MSTGLDSNPHEVLILGLRDRVRECLEHQQLAVPGSHARGYFEGSAKAYAFVAEVLLGGNGPLPPEDVEGKLPPASPNAKAFEAGREDGLAYVRDDMAIEGATPERLAVLREKATLTAGWDDAAINALGTEAFGALCGLSAADTLARDEAWDDACEAYNLGGAAGYVEARAEFLGEGA